MLPDLWDQKTKKIYYQFHSEGCFLTTLLSSSPASTFWPPALLKLATIHVADIKTRHCELRTAYCKTDADRRAMNFRKWLLRVREDATA